MEGATPLESRGQQVHRPATPASLMHPLIPLAPAQGAGKRLLLNSCRLPHPFGTLQAHDTQLVNDARPIMARMLLLHAWLAGRVICSGKRSPQRATRTGCSSPLLVSKVDLSER